MEQQPPPPPSQRPTTQFPPSFYWPSSYPGAQPPPAEAASHAERLIVGVRLASPSDGFDPVKSNQLIKSTVHKTDPDSGKVLTVGQWAVAIISESAEWLLKIAKRPISVREKGEDVVIITFGDGYEVILLLDGADLPKDWSKVTRIGIGVCVATIHDENDAKRLAQYGFVRSTDSLWEHLTDMADAAQSRRDVCVYFHTDATPSAADEDRSDGRRIIVHVCASRSDPYVVGESRRDHDLEQKLSTKPSLLLSSGTAGGSKEKSVGPAAAAMRAPAKKTAAAAISARLPLFNPKEYLILEKAFNPKATMAGDLKASCFLNTNVLKYTNSDLERTAKLLKKVQHGTLEEGHGYPESSTVNRQSDAARSQNRARANTPAAAFNPKQYMILSKAFCDNKLPARFFKVDESKFTATDLKGAKRLLKDVQKKAESIAASSAKEAASGMGTTTGTATLSQEGSSKDVSGLGTSETTLQDKNAAAEQEHATSKAGKSKLPESPGKRHASATGSKSKNKPRDKFMVATPREQTDQALAAAPSETTAQKAVSSSGPANKRAAKKSPKKSLSSGVEDVEMVSPRKRKKKKV